MSVPMIMSIAAFVAVYFVLSTDLLHKTVTVLLGACILIAAGVIPQEEAFRVIDWNVLFLLISMMVLVGITKKTGVFQYVAIKAAKAAKGEPIVILILLSLFTAFVSAFLDNVTTVLILTPVSILIAVELGISPIPFIIACAISSNVGGTATLIGDPPNIMIGSAAKLGFNDFVMNLTPVILVLLAVNSVIYYFLFSKKMVVTNERKARIMDFDESRTLENIPLMKKCLAVLALVIVGFIIHAQIHIEAGTIGLIGATLLMLISGRESVEEAFHEVDWATIFFFIGLFIMVGALVSTGVIKILADFLFKSTGGHIPTTTIVVMWFSGVLSAFIDNIPYVATVIPMIQSISDTVGSQAAMPLWWALSLGACLGGNGTLVGASANVVSAGLAGKSGYKISFMDFTKYGSFITVIDLFFVMGYLWIRYL